LSLIKSGSETVAKSVAIASPRHPPIFLRTSAPSAIARAQFAVAHAKYEKALGVM